MVKARYFPLPSSFEQGFSTTCKFKSLISVLVRKLKLFFIKTSFLLTLDPGLVWQLRLCTSVWLVIDRSYISAPFHMILALICPFVTFSENRIPPSRVEAFLSSIDAFFSYAIAILSWSDFGKSLNLSLVRVKEALKAAATSEPSACGVIVTGSWSMSPKSS